MISSRERKKPPNSSACTSYLQKDRSARPALQTHGGSSGSCLRGSGHFALTFDALRDGGAHAQREGEEERSHPRFRWAQPAEIRQEGANGRAESKSSSSRAPRCAPAAAGVLRSSRVKVLLRGRVLGRAHGLVCVSVEEQVKCVPAPTAVVRCAGESDECAPSSSRTAAVKPPRVTAASLPAAASKIKPQTQ